MIITESGFKKTQGIKWAFLIIISLFCAGFLTACSQNQNKINPQNILLITLDTTHADHLSCYGYDRQTSPNLDKIAKEGILFTNAYSSVPYTLASHTTLFTSAYPSDHGVVNNAPLMNRPIEQMLFPQLLKDKGFTTAAFVASNILHSKWSGFANAFHYYSNAVDIGDGTNKNLAINAAEQNIRVFKWLELNKEKQFFLWVHYYDPHFPYEAPPPFENRYGLPYKNKVRPHILNTMFKDIDHKLLPRTKTLQTEANQDEIDFLRAKYDEEIAFLDQHIGLLCEELEKTGLDTKTTIIIAGDHGESFDHNYLFHGFRLYESAIKVPLIIKSPLIENPGRTYQGIVELSDVFPTICDINGIPYASPNPNAKSFSPVLKKSDYFLAKPAFYELADDKTSQPKYIGPLKAIRAGNLKLIYNLDNGQRELYDLQADPQEKKNIYDLQKEAGTTLFINLSKMLLPQSQYKAEPIDQKELFETLKSLGYN